MKLNVYFVAISFAALVLSPINAPAGFECKREKNADGEVVTKCSQNEEKQIKIVVKGTEPKSAIGEEREDEKAPPELLEEIAKTNDASLLDWPCSSDRAPDVLMPESKNGTRSIGISGNYQAPACDTVSISFPTGLGTVILSCDRLKLRVSGSANICATAESVTADDLGLGKGLVYLRGATADSTAIIDPEGASKRPPQLVLESFGKIGNHRDMTAAGIIQIKGPAGGKTELPNLTMFSGSLSLENVSGGRITIYAGVRLYMKNSSIRYLRWAGTQKKKKWGYVGPLSSKP